MRKKIEKFIIPILGFIAVMIFVIFNFSGLAVIAQMTNLWNTGYQLPANNSVVDVSIGNIAGDADSGACQRVTNASGINYFIPSRYEAEWNTFQNAVDNNHLPGVTIADCCTARDSFSCSTDNNVHWFDSCGIEGEVRDECTCGCTGSACDPCCTEHDFCFNGDVWWLNCSGPNYIDEECDCGCWGNMSWGNCKGLQWELDGPTGNCTTNWSVGCNGSGFGSCGNGNIGNTFYCGAVIGSCPTNPSQQIEYKYTCRCQ